MTCSHYFSFVHVSIHTSNFQHVHVIVRGARVGVASAMQEDVKLPRGLRHLVFGRDFNQPLPRLGGLARADPRDQSCKGSLFEHSIVVVQGDRTRGHIGNTSVHSPPCFLPGHRDRGVGIFVRFVGMSRHLKTARSSYSSLQLFKFIVLDNPQGGQQRSVKTLQKCPSC